jgi:hypothetical protein
MTRRVLILAFAGMLAGFFIADSVVFAQPTKSGIKKGTQEAVKQGQEKWHSMTPEQQQQAIERGKEGAEKAEDKWQSMTPAQQEQAKERAKAGAQKARKKWQQLPQ